MNLDLNYLSLSISGTSNEVSLSNFLKFKNERNVSWNLNDQFYIEDPKFIFKIIGCDGSLNYVNVQKIKRTKRKLTNVSTELIHWTIINKLATFLNNEED